MKLRSLREQIESKCVHFNGLMNKSCRSGVVYDDLDKENRLPYRVGLPCFHPDSERVKGICQSPCENLRFPTEEEIQETLKAHDDAIEKMTTALKVIDPIRKAHKGGDWSGVIECPNCTGQLHVRHAGCNGHVHAKCETADCVAWME
jgi:hypothetical protein